MRLPAKLEPSQVTAIVDTREQLPLTLVPLKVQTATLDTGDYSLTGCEHIVRIERKSRRNRTYIAHQRATVLQTAWTPKSNRPM
jgi:hypothetical protein